MRAALVVAAALAGSGCAGPTAFVYSRQDAAQVDYVRALVSLPSDPTFLDRDLAPGVMWRAEIGRAICSADLVIVLWSTAAAASIEVGAEWRYALACGRRVVPVVLPGAPALPPELGSRQAIMAPGRQRPSLRPQPRPSRRPSNE